MNDQPAGMTTPPAKKPVRSQDPEQLADQILEVIPDFDQADLIVVMAANTAMQNRTADQALQLLGRRASPITKETLARAWGAVDSKLKSTFTNEWTGFLKRTWEGDPKQAPKVSFAYFEQRLGEELDQQKERMATASEIQTHAWQIIDRLGLDRSMFMTSAVPKIGAQALAKAREGASTFFFGSTDDSGKPALNWKTPAKIDRDEKDVQVILDDIGGILDEGFSGADAFSEIKARLGYLRDRVIKMLDDVIRRSKEQIADAEAIKHYAENDFATNDKPKLSVIDRLNAVLADVDKFYDVSEMAEKMQPTGQTPSAESEPPPPPARTFQSKIARH